MGWDTKEEWKMLIPVRNLTFQWQKVVEEMENPELRWLWRTYEHWKKWKPGHKIGMDTFKGIINEAKSQKGLQRQLIIAAGDDLDLKTVSTRGDIAAVKRNCLLISL